MNFKDFLNGIPKIESEILLGETAHLKMVPPERKELMINIDLATKNPKKAAVMMLFYPKNALTHLVLIVRNSYPGVHSSQIAFPGGKAEEYDVNLQETALRETHEEIGIPPHKINVIRPFTKIYIPPSNFMVHPFLGYCEHEIAFELQQEEVAGIIELPFSKFMDEAIVVSKSMDTSYSEAIEVPCFKVNEHYVWGATAMMLSELKETLKMAL
jgi:8-oxo-dGTP pyrophosphatase MutT (NUDIX family)